MLNKISSVITKLSGGAFTLYLTRGGAVLLQSVTLLTIAALISIEEFGQFTFMYGAAQVCAVILGFGGAQILQREMPAIDAKYQGRGNLNLVVKSFGIIFIMLLACTFVTALTYYYVIGKEYFSIDNSAFIILMTGFAIGLHSISISIVRVSHSATLSMLLKDALPYVLFLTGFSICYYNNYLTAKILIIVFLISVLFCFALAMFIARGYLSKRTGALTVDNISGRNYLTFWGSSIVSSMSAQIDIILAKMLLVDTDLGIYALLRKISNLISLPQIIANWSINVKVARDFALKNQSALQDHAKQGLYISIPMALILFSAFLVTSPVWLKLFDVNLDIYIYGLLAILCVGQLFNVMAGANLLFASHCREELYVFKSRVITLVSGVVIMVLLSNIYGSIGIAIGATISLMLLNLMVVLHVKNKTGILTSLQVPWLSK